MPKWLRRLMVGISMPCYLVVLFWFIVLLSLLVALDATTRWVTRVYDGVEDVGDTFERWIVRMWQGGSDGVAR